MPSFRKTKTPGVYVRHEKGCPRSQDDEDARRCRCTPSYRGRRRHPVTKVPEWSASMKDRSEVLTWLAAAPKAQDALVEAAAAGPTFRELGEQWLEGVQAGAVGKRRGKKGSAYSRTTLSGYRRSLRNQHEEFGARAAAEIVEVEWQMWADRLAREGLSRSRIRNHLAVASAIYGWASRPTRRLVDRNPTLAVELPPNDEQPRMRVCTAEEAAQLLAALEPDDQVAYALAFYAGLRAAMARRRPRRLPAARTQGQVRGRQRPAPADRADAAADPSRGVDAPGPAGRRRREHGVGHERPSRPARN